MSFNEVVLLLGGLGLFSFWRHDNSRGWYYGEAGVVLVSVRLIIAVVDYFVRHIAWLP